MDRQIDRQTDGQTDRHAHDGKMTRSVRWVYVIEDLSLDDIKDLGISRVFCTVCVAEMVCSVGYKGFGYIQGFLL